MTAPSPKAVSLARDDRPGRDAWLARADGALRIGFGRDAAGVTRLRRLEQHSPLRALRPLEAGAEPVAVVLNTGGGVCGGDRLTTEVALDDGAIATVTSQAAEKVYRALDSRARLRTTLRVAEGARLHWAPRETILFDGARLERCTEIGMEPGARLLAAEMLVFGRSAMGEAVHVLDLRDDWRVRIAGALRWADALELVGEPPLALHATAGLAGHEALATVLWIAPDPERLCDLARETLGGFPVRAGASVLRGLGISRLLGAASAVRAALARLLSALRVPALGFGAELPRVWAV